MDNQYNYYDPNKEDKNNIFDEQPQGMNGERSITSVQDGRSWQDRQLPLV